MRALKRILSLMLAAIVSVISPITAFAAEMNASIKQVVGDAEYDDRGINTSEVDNLIEAVDMEMLIENALNEVQDVRVSDSDRQSMVASAEFVPAGNEEVIDIKLKQTVQKIGETTKSNGEIADVYVTAAVASDIKTKVDNGYRKLYDVEAYVYIYWVDNLGTENELYKVAASWDTHGKSVRNRKITYGITDPTGFIFLKSTEEDVSGTSYNKVVHGEYTALVVGAKSSIEVVNDGTLNCYVHNSALTT